MLNCCGSLAKFLVVATNLVVFLVSCVSTGFGVYYLTVIPEESESSVVNATDDGLDLVPEDDDGYAAKHRQLIVATSFSGAIVLISLFGCLGAWMVGDWSKNFE